MGTNGFQSDIVLILLAAGGTGASFFITSLFPTLLLLSAISTFLSTSPSGSPSPSSSLFKGVVLIFDADNAEGFVGTSGGFECSIGGDFTDLDGAGDAIGDWFSDDALEPVRLKGTNGDEENPIGTFIGAGEAVTLLGAGGVGTVFSSSKEYDWGAGGRPRGFIFGFAVAMFGFAVLMPTLESRRGLAVESIDVEEYERGGGGRRCGSPFGFFSPLAPFISPPKPFFAVSPGTTFLAAGGGGTRLGAVLFG